MAIDDLKERVASMKKQFQRENNGKFTDYTSIMSTPKIPERIDLGKNSLTDEEKNVPHALKVHPEDASLLRACTVKPSMLVSQSEKAAQQQSPNNESPKGPSLRK